MAAGTYFYLNMNKAPRSSVTPSTQAVVKSGDNSDAQIDADLKAVDSNLNSLDSQSGNVDASINQTQTDPSSGF